MPLRKRKSPGATLEPSVKRVLLFDLVGTLVDEASDYESLDAAFEAARERFRIPDEASALSGDFSLALMEILRGEDPDGETPGTGPASEFVPFEEAAKEIFRAVLEVRGVEATEADAAWFWATFVATQRRTIRLHADAEQALAWARAKGYQIWVLTDADPYFLRDVLAGTGLAERWDGVVTAAEAGYPKPDPRLFLHALSRAGALPADAIMVGDSYERDLLGARAAGIHRAVLVDRHRARTVDDVPVITSLAALPSALARLAPSLN
ncbi:MAG: phosphoserine phosphatase [Thermoplasmata archaeon]|jgi:HAD superfamily hydrolase (TIGR01509 family)|nr:phosphoserine phosphatase [Thermoplasmata archaeon]